MRGSEKDAQNVLVQRLADVAKGIITEQGQQTFNWLADEYLAASTTRVEATSLAWYKRTLEHHIRPSLGKMRIAAIRSIDVQDTLNSARKLSKRNRGKPLSARSSQNILVTIRAVLRWGVKMGMIARNVADAIDVPKSDSCEIEGLSLDDVRGLLAASVGTDLEAIIAFAIGTGLRRGEMCALRWGDIDLDSGQYSVRQSAAMLDGKVIIKSPKSKRSRRTDVLPPFVVAVLLRHRARQREEDMALGMGNIKPEDYVFDRAGEAWQPNHLSQRFSRLVRRKKLRLMRFHDLRHGFASLAFAAGVPLKVVSDSLGHSGIAITSSTYVHLLTDQKRAKSDLLDAYLRPAVGGH